MSGAIADLSFATITCIALIISFGPPLFLYWLFYYSPLKAYFHGGAGVEPAIIGAVGLLFGLFAAFLANDIWARNQLAHHSVVQEADAMRTLARYAEGMGKQHTEAMQLALTDYGNTVIEKDWPEMTNGRRSKEILGKVRAISNMIVSGDLGRDAGPSIQGRMIDAYTAMRENRQTRVQLAESRQLTIKWYAVLVFGLLTQVAIAIVHVTRPRPNLFAQIIFGGALAACLTILLTHEFPFSGMNPISPEPMHKAIESLARK